LLVYDVKKCYGIITYTKGIPSCHLLVIIVTLYPSYKTVHLYNSNGTLISYVSFYHYYSILAGKNSTQPGKVMSGFRFSQGVFCIQSFLFMLKIIPTTLSLFHYIGKITLIHEAGD